MRDVEGGPRARGAAAAGLHRPERSGDGTLRGSALRQKVRKSSWTRGAGGMGARRPQETRLFPLLETVQESGKLE